MKKTLGRRFGAGLAGIALAGAGFVAVGAADAAHAGVTIGGIEFDPERFKEVKEGTKFKAILLVTVDNKGLARSVQWNITNSNGLKCTPETQEVPVDAKRGRNYLVKDCEVTDGTVDKAEVSYEIISEKGTQPGNFGFNPTKPTPGPTAPTTDPTAPTTDPTTTAPDPTTTTSAPSEDPSGAPAPEISIASGTFDPPSAVVKEGGKFKFTKAVTIKGVPLNGDLTMKLSNYTNLDCKPTEGTIPAGSEPGTYEFTFDCEFGAGIEAASGEYTISGDDLPEDVTGKFGYGNIDEDDDSSDGGNGSSDGDKGSSDGDSDTDGDLADTGAPAVGVVLAGGLAAAAAGGLMLRRRR